jgi:hypothetical protein
MCICTCAGVFLAGVPLLRYGSKALKGGFDWLTWRQQLLIATIRDIQVSQLTAVYYSLEHDNISLSSCNNIIA